jgi:hypothetical protein
MDLTDVAAVVCGALDALEVLDQEALDGKAAASHRLLAAFAGPQARGMP